MSEASAQKPVDVADVRQSTVSDETSRAEDFNEALALVGGDDAPQDAPTDAPGEETPAPTDAPPEAQANPEEEKAPEGPAAGGWAKVKRKEQKLLEKMQKFEREQQQWQAQVEDFNKRFESLKAREEAIAADPIGYLSKNGLSFDDVARRYLNDGKASPEEASRRAAEQQGGESKKLLEKIEQLEQRLERQDNERHLNEYRGGVRQVLGTQEFELLSAYPNAEQEVVDYVAKHARATGQVLKPYDAAVILQRVWKEQLQALSSHKAIRGHLGIQDKQQVAGGQSQVPQGKRGESPRTLTNNLAATPPVGEPDMDSLSAEEEFQAALRLVQD